MTRARRSVPGAELLGLVCALAWAPGAAQACSIALLPPGYKPPTPEQLVAQQLAYDRQSQHDLWLKADHVFTVRIVDPDDVREPPRLRGPIPPPRAVRFHLLGEGKTLITLEAVAALKGALPTRRFDLRDAEGWTSCGPPRQFDVFTLGRDDALFVVFMSGAYPTQGGILEAMAVERVADPDLRAALEASGAGR